MQQKHPKMSKVEKDPTCFLFSRVCHEIVVGCATIPSRRSSVEFEVFKVFFLPNSLINTTPSQISTYIFLPILQHDQYLS